MKSILSALAAVVILLGVRIVATGSTVAILAAVVVIGLNVWLLLALHFPHWRSAFIFRTMYKLDGAAVAGLAVLTGLAAQQGEPVDPWAILLMCCLGAKAVLTALVGDKRAEE